MKDFEKAFLSSLFNSAMLEAIEDGRQFRYNPKSDINTVELAVCLPLAILTITGQKFEVHAKIYDAMTPECQRHFKVEPIENII